MSIKVMVLSNFFIAAISLRSQFFLEICISSSNSVFLLQAYEQCSVTKQPNEVILNAQNLKLKECPDIETASDAYRKRFEGGVGEFFLGRQAKLIEASVLSRFGGEKLKVLEVGGGHGQLTSQFLDMGHEVWVQASAEACLDRLKAKYTAHGDSLNFVVSPLTELPFADNSFELVVAVRLLGHFEPWQSLLAELVRVSKQMIVLDYAPMNSFNVLIPILFPLKKLIEGDTRRYSFFRARNIRNYLRAQGYGSLQDAKQFFLPMVLHRLVGNADLSRTSEEFFERIGLTDMFGAPALLIAQQSQ